MELDPLFVRGLRLLHSRAADSTEQLWALYEEIKSRNDRGAGSTLGGGKSSPANMSPRSTPSLQPRSLESHKRPLMKYRDDKNDATSNKKLHLDSGATARSYPSSPSFSRDSDSGKHGDDTDLSDTAGLEMDFMNQLACVVCRNIGVTTGNQLKECSSCGALYHQDCHRPAISDSEYSSSRAPWSCYKCRTTSSISSTSRPVLQKTVSSSSSSSSSSTFSKLDRIKSDSSLAKKHFKSSSRSSSQRPSGSSSSSSLSSSTSSTFSSTSSARWSAGGGAVSNTHTSAGPPPNSMVSAERRMQLMKKKAAAKLNEKRKN